MMNMWKAAVVLTITGCAARSGAPLTPALQETGADAVYYIYVGAESADLLHRIRFGPTGMDLDQTTPVGEMAVETEGPHGLNVSPDGDHLYMTTAHGVPDGKLWKFHAGPDTLVAPPILLGNFPATLDLTPDGLYAFIVNFNLHGEHVPSTVSVVYTPDLVEVDQIPTCTMPHGLRMAKDGLFVYSNCMMDDQLVEIDTRTFEVSRRFSVTTGSETALLDYQVGEVVTGANGITRPLEPFSDRKAMESTCSPTWAQPTPDGRSIFVACNKSNEILVVDRASWTLERRISVPGGPYNLAISEDGKILIASLKSAGKVQFFEASTGKSLGLVASTTTLTHGVAVTPDSRYAFVSMEGKGADPGKVDAYDLQEFQLVGSIEVGQQAGGIIFWKMEPIS